MKPIDRSSKFWESFYKAQGFGKDEAEHITEYDTWMIRNDPRSCKYMMVGRELAVYLDSCGKHYKFQVCRNHEEHGAIGGRDFWHNVVRSCRNYRCHICWKYGWAVFNAKRIEARFQTVASLVDGFSVKDVEHVTSSVPQDLYDLSANELIREGVRMARLSGVDDGCAVFHPFRKDRETRELFFSPHLHMLAWVAGGYDRCCSCGLVPSKENCAGCSGFEGVTRRVHELDGWIVKVISGFDEQQSSEKGEKKKRKDRSIFGTAWYVLEHSGYPVDYQRFNIVRYFGRLAKRGLTSKCKPFLATCKVCRSPMEEQHLPYGARVVANRGECGFMKDFTLPHVTDEELDGIMYRKDGEEREEEHGDL